jgi:type I restriction enzyme S subunit
MSLALTPEQRAIVRDILQSHLPPSAKIWVFGSRATGGAKPFSDLDLAIDAARPLTLDETASLRDAFSESDLPWKVDVVDTHTIDAGFRQIILTNAVRF